MKDIVQDLFRRETSWWSTLTAKDKSKLFPDWEPSSIDDVPIEYLCMSGQVALVLAGIKPCTIVQSRGHHGEYGQLFLNMCCVHGMTNISMKVAPFSMVLFVR